MQGSLRILLLLVATFLVAFPATGAAPAASPLQEAAVSIAGPGPDPETTAAEPSGWLTSATHWVLVTQRQLHRQLTEALQGIEESPGLAAPGWLILISFLYGVFHAAGPGHGKAVITTYLLTHREQPGRGILLSVCASMLQGVTAIVLVLALLAGLGWLARETMAEVRTLESASYLIIAMLGLWLMWRGLQGTRRHPEDPARHGRPDAEGSGPAVCGCGHSQVVSPASGSAWWLAVLAIGIRPCAGAVLVMSVAFMLGIWHFGILAVLAMSTGTAITVAALSVIAVWARELAARMTVGSGSAALQRAGPVVAIAGGLVILWIGATLLWGSLAAPAVLHPLGL